MPCGKRFGLGLWKKRQDNKTRKSQQDNKTPRQQDNNKTITRQQDNIAVESFPMWTRIPFFFVLFQ
jgi:hypothetical protein